MSCCGHDGLLPYDEAVARLLEAARPIGASERVRLADARGRVLAEDVVATLDVPPADNSAMDGYALCVDDIADAPPVGSGGVRLPVSQRVPAGVPPQPLRAGSAARIFTGSEIPPGADSVVMQERCRLREERCGDGSGRQTFVELPADIARGEHIRARGMDITAGSRILERGHKLLPQDLGLLASIGRAEVRVYRKLRIAILSTGDEIVEPGEACPAGHIYNSNRYTLAGLIDALGMERVDFGIVADDADATIEVLRRAAQQADCIVTTGGVSVGEEDHVKACVETLGELQLWRLAIKPGKPLAYGQILDKPFFGLPGNPSAVFVTFAMVVRPCLLRLQGCTEGLLPAALTVQAGFSREFAGKRHEFMRARLGVSTGGEMLASLHENQSSGALTSASWGNGFALQRVGQVIAAGDRIEFIPFSELFA